MTDLKRLKLLVDIPSGDGESDELLSMLLEHARTYLLSYCRLDFADESMTPLILSMAAEDFGRLEGSGLSYRTVSGASEGYLGEYSPRIMTALRRYRRLGGTPC